ncbi:MAG: hypothetical protein ACYC0Y_01545 [Pirellulales bacterium]
MSEADFLAWQAEAATAAFGDAIDDLKARLRNVADVRAWTQRHPWIALGAAAAAGFAAATGVSAVSHEGTPEKRSPTHQRRRVETLPSAAASPVPHGELAAVLAALLAPAIDRVKAAMVASFLSMIRGLARSGSNGRGRANAAGASRVRPPLG